MASNFISVLFNLLASFCGWGSFAISIAAVVVADWTRREVLDLRYGLFERCTISTDECEPIPGKISSQLSFQVILQDAFESDYLSQSNYVAKTSNGVITPNRRKKMPKCVK